MIKLTGWFVGKNQPGLGRDGSRQRNALRLASGQLIRKLVGNACKANRLQGFDSFGPWRGDVSGKPQGDFDVFDDT